MGVLERLSKVLVYSKHIILSNIKSVYKNPAGLSAGLSLNWIIKSIRFLLTAKRYTLTHN